MSEEEKENTTIIHEAPDYSWVGCFTFLILFFFMVGGCTMLRDVYKHELKKLDIQLEIEKEKAKQ